MRRKRMTQRFPWLLPLRKRQRIFCFYTKMKWDGEDYAAEQPEARFPYLLFESGCPLYNRNTGFDMIYQENKVFNLKLAAVPLDKLAIYPGETFSFWQRARHADRETPYRDGLAEVDGKLTTQPGGGLCQMSNLLFWIFLHTPLTIVERHGHVAKDFPEPPSDAPKGVDAAVSEGWMDLKVRNDTDTAFQIRISFEEEQIVGRVFTDRETGVSYQVVNEELLYYRKNDRLFEEVNVVRNGSETASGRPVSRTVLYRNKCKIGYPLPEGTPIQEKGCVQ